MTQYAKICVPVPLKTEFIYCFDSEKLQVIPGVRVMVPFGSRRTRGYVIGLEDSAPDSGFSVREIIRVIDKEPVFSKKDYELALWMEKFYFSSRGEILDTMIPGGRRDVGFGAVSFDGDAGGGDFELSDDQKNAVNIVTESDKGLFYLYGVTGSGKTEVFLRCAKDVIDHGGQVIYLVPEITLTHQLARQVLNRFENNVAILHSGLTDAQRITQWRRIKRGEVGLVIGARSAVFAPCDRLKMIIIDEEHENSYKSGNSPRYHARQVAQKRISDCGGKLLMGSATPSLEAWAMMKDPSRMIRLDLRQRVGGGAMPEVTVADMSGEKGIFSALLQKKMTDALGAGRQVILFLNRRGYSYYFHCRNCGFELKCPHCDVAMTYHRKSGELICHYCGSRRKPLKVCPECHSTDVMYSGFGTEQVENELMKLFPSVPVARLDTDTVSSDRKLIDRTLEDFRTGKTKILLGTQMVAKGLNFPNVSLVGIILADSGLLIPDFRAEERTFDLLVQVSGRSGRADSSGEVVIQTRMKNSPAITYACNAKTGEFFDRELEIRRQTGFPPFSRLINIVIRSRKQEAAYTTSCNLAEKLRERHGDFEVFGAQECPIEKVRENYRFQVILRSRKASSAMKALSDVLSEVKIPSAVTLEVDVDPLDML